MTYTTIDDAFSSVLEYMSTTTKRCRVRILSLKSFHFQEIDLHIHLNNISNVSLPPVIMSSLRIIGICDMYVKIHFFVIPMF